MGENLHSEFELSVIRVQLIGILSSAMLLETLYDHYTLLAA